MGVAGTMGNYTPNRKSTSQGGATNARLPGGGAGVQAQIDGTGKHNLGTGVPGKNVNKKKSPKKARN